MSEASFEDVRRKYRRNARFYNLLGPLQRRHRANAVDRLGLEPGASVLDAGSGTGLSFELLQARVGPAGRIIALEVSSDMMGRARQRAAARRWRNVTFIEAAAESADLPADLDAALFFYTHDVMQSREALENVLAALRPEARVVAAGARSPGGMAGRLLGPAVRAYSAPFVTNLANFERPWSLLEELIGPMAIEPRLLGTAYVATGRKPG